MDLLSAYREMLRIRRFEEAALRCAADGLVAGALHPYTGQEAVAVGVLAERDPAEWVVSFYRCHGHALAAGSPPEPLLREILGRAGGVCGGRAGSMHLADRRHRLLGASSIVAGQVPVAAGVAMAEQADGAGRAVVAFCGDGAMAAGVTYETLNIAAVLDLPLLLVCEDNGWQDHTPTHLVQNRTPAQVAVGLGLPCREVDGNDVEAVREAAAELLLACRGGGPRVLVARTYLRHFHSQLGGAVPPEYRPSDERGYWAARDPLEVAAARLDGEQVATVRQAVTREMDAVLAGALAAPPPDATAAEDAVTTAPWPVRT